MQTRLDNGSLKLGFAKGVLSLDFELRESAKANICVEN